MKESNHHFSFTITLKSTLEKVWDTLIDVQKWPVWDTELIDSKLEGNFKLGAKGIMTPKKGPKLEFHISEFIQNKTYTIHTKMPIGQFIIKRTLNTENGEVKFTDDIEFSGFFKGIFGFILGKQFRKILPEVLNNFKKLAESK
jgi:Polyketide cyclase / dehydrase and lipid transport